ncbi:MAG: 3-oxo-tetronate kinase [Paracoccaceae bacterium]
MSIRIGAVADDFTGATDLANTFMSEGLSCVQVIGQPAEDIDLGDADAVVVALKSRTAPVGTAVAESLGAVDWLKARGARQIISKYCSTFDSTKDGNIGPIADAMMARLDTDFALVCPAFPGAGRTIYKGQLFVGDQLLADSPMKDHPLTPMRDSDLMRLMGQQSKHDVGLIDLATVRAGAGAITARINALKQQGFKYGVIDVVDDSDLDVIGQVAYYHALVTGGSGIAKGLPAAWRAAGHVSTAKIPSPPMAQGRTVILAGSCSQATRAQIANIPADWGTYQVAASDVAGDPKLADEISAWIDARKDTAPCVIYSSADPSEVAKVQQSLGAAQAGHMIETLMGQVAQHARNNGIKRLIVAGGETSGAVVSALGISALRIGPQIASGVPWCETLDADRVAVALKSGNFGGADFFADALNMLG